MFFSALLGRKWAEMEKLREWKRKVIWSAVAGMLAAVLMLGSGEKPGLLCWWGTMYPRFCFAETEPAEHSLEQSVPLPKLKISFWLAKAFDWC